MGLYDCGLVLYVLCSGGDVELDIDTLHCYLEIIFFFIIWDSVGFTIMGLRSYIWLEKLVWQAFVGYLKYCFVMLDVDHLEGMELAKFWDMESLRAQLLATFTSNLY